MFSSEQILPSLLFHHPSLWIDRPVLPFGESRVREGRRDFGPFVSPNFQTAGILSLDLKSRSLTSCMGIAQMLKPPLQRRTAVRYKLRLPVIFHWNDGFEHTSGGFTSDVSLEGALILSKESPPVGARVRVEILLPSPEMGNEELCIECSGKVIHSSVRAGYSAFGFHGVFQDDQLTRHVLDIESRR